jgi:hypothetical protein
MKSRSDRLCDVEGELLYETERAYRIDFGGDEPVWIPKSQVECNGDGTFTMPEWLAIEKEIL